MCATRELLKHPCGILGTAWLPQDFPVHDDRRVSRKDEATRFAGADCAGLGFGDAADIRVGRFVRRDVFIDVGRLNLDVDSGFAKQVGASRRRRGENQAHGLIMV